MKNVFEIRTDLALEVNEQVNREKGRLKGVIINEMKDNKTGIKITPHMLRHYFGNERRKAGWSLELIQLAYGHRHIQTTINYLDIVDDELLDASQEFYEKHSSLYGIEELL